MEDKEQALEEGLFIKFLRSRCKHIGTEKKCCKVCACRLFELMLKGKTYNSLPVVERRLWNESRNRRHYPCIPGNVSSSDFFSAVKRLLPVDRNQWPADWPEIIRRELCGGPSAPAETELLSKAQKALQEYNYKEFCQIIEDWQTLYRNKQKGN